MASIGCICIRHRRSFYLATVQLRKTLKNILKCLKKSGKRGIILNEAQVSALEKKKLDDETCSEIETAHLSYLASQDTFYAGKLKVVGRTHQQSFIATSAKLRSVSCIRLKARLTRKQKYPVTNL